jgi:hypothetical protein
VALASPLPDDNGPTGVYWSPEVGVVVSVDIDTSVLDELAPVIGGMRVP